MKHIREMAKASRASKLARFCGGGDVARVKKGMPARDGEPAGYAHGGMVGGGMAEGMPAKPRLDRGGHKKPGKAAKAGTHVNVVVMPHSGGGAPPPDAGAMPPMPPGGPGPAMPPMPPPGVGAGAGGPPMPMGGGMPGQKHGGKVSRYAKGGKVKKADGGEVDNGDDKDEAAKVLRQSPGRVMVDAAASAALKENADKHAASTYLPRYGTDRDFNHDDRYARKNGGKVNTHEKREHKSVGGPAKPPRGFDAGAGSGEGRLEKKVKYGK